MTCKYCKGRGWNKAEYGIMGKAPCPDCKGTGVIDEEEKDDGADKYVEAVRRVK